METTPSLLLSEKLSSHASDHGWVTVKDRKAVSLTTSACLAIFFRSSTESLLQDNVFVARSQH